MFNVGIGRLGIIDSHPEIVTTMIEMLENVRKTGSIINGTVAQLIILGILQSMLPTVLLENRGHFKASSRWIRHFCASQLGWAFEKAPLLSPKRF